MSDTKSNTEIDLPPRAPGEPDATVHQLTWLWNAGFQDQTLISSLGKEQALWLINQKKGNAQQHQIRRVGNKKRMALVGFALVVLAVVSFRFLGQQEETAAAPASVSSSQAGKPASAEEEPGSSVISPEKRRLISVAGAKAAFAAVKRRITGRGSAPAEKSPGSAPAGKPFDVGTEVVLKKAIGVRVREGMVVLQPGTRVIIVSKTSDRLVFKHQFGQSEMATADFLP